MCLCTTKYFITFYMIVLQVFIQSFYRPVGFIVPGLRWLLLWLTVPGDNMLLFFMGMWVASAVSINDDDDDVNNDVCGKTVLTSG